MKAFLLGAAFVVAVCFSTQASAQELKTAKVGYAFGGINTDGYEFAAVPVRYRFLNCAGELQVAYSVDVKAVEVGDRYFFDGKSLSSTEARKPELNAIHLQAEVKRDFGGRIGSFSDSVAGPSLGFGCFTGQTRTIGRLSDYLPSDAKPEQVQAFLDSLILIPSQRGFALRNPAIEGAAKAEADRLRKEAAAKEKAEKERREEEIKRREEERLAESKRLEEEQLRDEREREERLAELDRERSESNPGSGESDNREESTAADEQSKASTERSDDVALSDRRPTEKGSRWASCAFTAAGGIGSKIALLLFEPFPIPADDTHRWNVLDEFDKDVGVGSVVPGYKAMSFLGGTWGCSTFPTEEAARSSFNRHKATRKYIVKTISWRPTFHPIETVKEDKPAGNAVDEPRQQSAGSSRTEQERAIAKAQAEAEWNRKVAEHEAALARYEADVAAVEAEKARQAAQLATAAEAAQRALREHEAKLRAQQEQYQKQLQEHARRVEENYPDSDCARFRREKGEGWTVNPCV